MGGAFYVGFKLYVHELMLAVCLLPLIANVALKKESAMLLRTRIPPSIILIAFYIFAHWFICVAYNKISDYGGVGQVSRQYMNAGWPFILFFAFYLFGKTKYLKTALILMFVTYMLRFAAGIYFFVQQGGFDSTNIFTEVRQTVYIPLINYIPKVGNADDLRITSISLASIAMAYFSFSKNFFSKLFSFMIVSACFVGCLLGGGRAALLIFLILVLYWNFITKNVPFLILSGVIGGSALVYINLDPYSIEALPDKMQRAVSAFVVTEDNLSIKRGISQSDEFHKRLREEGWERATENFASILFGHGIRPFDETAWFDQTRDDVTKKSEQAKLTGRYEKGFFTVVATLGFVGFALYLNILRYLIWDIIKSLWRNNIRDTQHIFYFLATFSIISWLITMFITGGFPSEEIMLGLFARVAFEDSRRAKGLGDV
ncbi:MAG: hypothetical protein AAGA18_12950 [Verrucomicrobiota bacterium]